MTELILTSNGPGVVVARSSNPLDQTRVHRLARDYWQQAPSEPGVYILCGDFEGRPAVYVGMTDSGLRNRIGQHAKDPNKSWFRTAYAIPMGRDLSRPIEGALIRLFAEASYAAVMNSADEAAWADTENVAAEGLLSAIKAWLVILLGSEMIYPTAPSAPASSQGRQSAGSSRPTWTREQWLDWVERDGPTGTRAALEEVVHELESKGRRITFGSGQHQAGMFPVIDTDGKNYWLMSVYAKAFYIALSPLSRRPVTDDPIVLQELMDRLNAIEGINVKPDDIDKYPPVKIEVLINDSTRRQLLDVEQWLADTVRRSVDPTQHLNSDFRE
jgi:hypothetical protein